MNKQQLAAKIWASANNMRSKIEANEYKDYILGFIFYKFLSEREEQLLKKEHWSEEDFKDLIDEGVDPSIKTLNPSEYNALSADKKEHLEAVKHCQEKLGYFISYDNLFSTWLRKGQERTFDVANVSDALNAFTRLIYKTHKKVFTGIFDTLQKGLDKLGDSSGSRTKAISALLELIKDIPMDDKQDYDVLGFIYEYLISNFAANAGKKAGEFYTPHEVSLVMSEIVSYHLKDKDRIEIYDPTSGSGSLLINIGNAVGKYMNDRDKIKYYAQELKENTYNLTRMNLVMRGILPDNIVARNGDTLADDWPYFDDNDKENTYEPLYVNAVVSNPPYSQKWEPPKKDSRFDKFGFAPKGKADYAFLLHDLYHLKPDGIMTIVLPHGVLFRGGEEAEIRKNLIESNHIDAVIGLPSNIFFGTGIPTIIMVLKQKRSNTDVLIIDASKGFIKVGKNNKLRACDIKKIVDTYIERADSVDKYSRKVSRDEIRKNEYNLNIPRYVDSSDKVESYDIYSCMFGGIPNSEINELKSYWDAFPSLKSELFKSINNSFSSFKVEDIKKTVSENKDVKAFIKKYQESFDKFDKYLFDNLIIKHDEVIIPKEESLIALEIFKRIKNNPLVDKYDAYQLLDDEWKKTAIDLEIIQTEGFDAVKVVDPNYIIKKKKDGGDVEVQNGWKGHIIPFELIWKSILNNEYDSLSKKQARSVEIDSMLNSSLIEEISDEDKEGELDLFNDEKDGFVNSEVLKYCKKLDEKSIKDKDSFDYKILQAGKLIAEQKSLKKAIKSEESALETKTKQTIENLKDDDCKELLKQKWINPILSNLFKVPLNLLNSFANKLVSLSKKYETTLEDLERDIKKTEKDLSSMIDDLEANEFDKKGLKEFKKLLGDDNE